MRKRRRDEAVEQSSGIVKNSAPGIPHAPTQDSLPGQASSPASAVPRFSRGLSTSDVIELLSSLASLGSLVIAVYALVTTFQFRRELAYPEQVSHIADLFIEVYLDRRFPEPVKIDGTEYKTLKDVREIVRRRMRGKPIADQRKLLDEFREATLRSDSWQNAFAYQLTLAQERVGALVFTGVLPLETVLAVSSYGILEDWAYSSRLIEGCRTSSTVPSTAQCESAIRQAEDPKSISGTIPFQRRHGEWLACVAALYSWKYWTGEKQDLFISYLGTRATILEKEQTLRSFEHAILYSRVERSVTAFRQPE